MSKNYFNILIKEYISAHSVLRFAQEEGPKDLRDVMDMLINRDNFIFLVRLMLECDMTEEDMVEIAKEAWMECEKK